MKIAVIGATGVVGREILEVLSERNFPLTDLVLVASKKSHGKPIYFNDKLYETICIEDILKKNIDIALFAAGAEVSKIWAPKLAKKGCKVIDNSSYWRMSSTHKLVVPEINGSQLTIDDMIIANPNCSTIQLVMVLAPLHKKFVVSRVVISTYQSVSGTGKKAIEQLKNEENNIEGEMVYPHKIHHNAIPHCDEFEDNGYTKEEMKITNETKKILDETINVVATAARVPVLVGHSESVNIAFKNDFELDDIRSTLDKMSGVTVFDNTAKNQYPTPKYCYKKDEIFVGRIRKDFTQEKTLNIWIAADNLRKGASTNAVQIAEFLIYENLI